MTEALGLSYLWQGVATADFNGDGAMDIATNWG